MFVMLIIKFDSGCSVEQYTMHLSVLALQADMFS